VACLVEEPGPGSTDRVEHRLIAVEPSRSSLTPRRSRIQTMDKTREVADAVLAELETRQGFREWWASLDPETQNQIMEAIGTAAIEAVENSD
jgi:hypothetical protein